MFMRYNHSSKHACPERICITLNVSFCALRTIQNFQWRSCLYSSPVVMSEFCELSLSFLVSPQSSDFSTFWTTFVSKHMKVFCVYFSHRVEGQYTCKRNSRLVGVCAIVMLYSYCHMPLYSANDIYAYFGYVSGKNGRLVQCHGTYCAGKKASHMDLMPGPSILGRWQLSRATSSTLLGG